MRAQLCLVVALSFIASACDRRAAEIGLDSSQVQQPASSEATASPTRPDREQPKPADKPADSTTASSSGKESGTFPATPTPTVTSENAIATMRQQLQRLDTASVQTLQGRTAEHGKRLGDLLTTMRVEVQAATSPTKNTWLASADSIENDLDRLALAQGEELRTVFRAHRVRVLRLLEEFRVLVPVKSL